MSLFDEDDNDDIYIDDNYNPYIDNYTCKRGNKLNIKTQWCCFECERERMNNKYNYTNNYSNINPLQIYWNILQLIPPKTLQEIKQQYHKLCKIYHPDKGGDSEKFIKLKNSYDKLICSF